MKIIDCRNVLIVGTGNVGRSLMVEAYLNHAARGRWRANSAGRDPAGMVDPLTATILAEFDLRPELRSKSWTEFTGPAAPIMDVVITICAATGGESCPVWPGAPRQLHWPIPDPVATCGALEDRLETYRAVFELIRHAVDDFLAEEAGAAAA